MNALSSGPRAQIMAVLKTYAGLPGPPFDPELSVINLARESEVDLLAAFIVAHELSGLGVLIPGKRPYLMLPLRDIEHIRDAHEVYNWPNFTVTPFGREYLLSGVDPMVTGDAFDYIRLLKSRMPALPEVVEQYANEAKRAFDRGLWLGVSVLLGIAANALLEALYDAMGGHLDAEARKKYTKTLNKTRNAQPRYATFTAELTHHSAAIPQDVWQRYKTLFEALTTVYKINRDDVAHHRTTRIDQDTATAALHSFPALVQLISDLVASLTTVCTCHLM